MRRISCRITVILLMFLAISAVNAQERTAKTIAHVAAPVITGSGSADRLRFTAPSSVVQMQLQVYNDSGQTLFDVSSKGNSLDWTMQDGSG
jgi:hypothetical protein